jgi:Mor family transcriptional regulator
MDIGKKVFLKGEANQPEIFGIKLPGFLTGTKESEVEESEVEESEVEESEVEESEVEESEVEESEVEESEVEESEVEESEVDESEVEEAKKKPLSRKEINAQVSQINNTSIYFKENTLPYWCIKSKLYFTEY